MLKAKGFWTSSTEFVKAADMCDFIKTNRTHLSARDGYKAAFTKDSALAYIKNHCPELVISFTTAFHYAIEADVFRVAYAQKNDCIWLDSDLYPQRYTKHLLQAIAMQKFTSEYCLASHQRHCRVPVTVFGT